MDCKLAASMHIYSPGYNHRRPIFLPQTPVTWQSSTEPVLCIYFLGKFEDRGPNQSLIGQDAGRIQFCPASSLLHACSTYTTRQVQENGWSRLWEQSPNCTEESSDWQVQVLNAVAKAHENVLINLISHHLNIYFLILLWRTVPRAGITAGKMHAQYSDSNCHVKSWLGAAMVDLSKTWPRDVWRGKWIVVRKKGGRTFPQWRCCIFVDRDFTRVCILPAVTWAVSCKIVKL